MIIKTNCGYYHKPGFNPVPEASCIPCVRLLAATTTLAGLISYPS